MKKIVIAVILLALMVSTFAGCGSTNNTSSTTSDNVTAEATKAADPTAGGAAESDAYTGSAPITTEAGQSLKILAQTSNYTNVDITNAEIVKKVIADAGITVEWQLVDYTNYKDSVALMLSTGSVVITSYSIHYTKLYEKQKSLKTLQKKKWKNSIKSFRLLKR